jgi:hypothetical protein
MTAKTPYEGRLPCGKDCQQDGSRWVSRVTWNEALQSGPVHGYLLLIADARGYVNVLDLRTPVSEVLTDEEQWQQTREALSRHNAKWWAYFPLSPPLNVAAIPMRLIPGQLPEPVEANDPPAEEWIYARNVPHAVLNGRPHQQQRRVRGDNGGRGQ